MRLIALVALLVVATSAGAQEITPQDLREISKADRDLRAIVAV